MVKCRDFNKILLNKNSFKPNQVYKTRKSVISLDTETERGLAFVIGIQTDKTKSIFRIKSFNDFINCIKMYSNRSLLFFYNLNYDYQALIKLLSDNQIQFLMDYDTLETKDFIINYIPNKCFDLFIKSINKNYKFFDIAQFFSHMSLDNTGKKFFNVSKLSLSDEGIDIKNLSAVDYDNDIKYKNIIDKYLLRDIELTYKLCSYVIDLSIDTLDLYPKTLYSQASIFQQKYLELARRKLSLPSRKILQYGLNAYNGGRFECFKKGFFENAQIEDINSAYPKHMAELPNLDGGKWIKDKSYHSDSLISLFKVSFVIQDMKISPIKNDNKNLGLCYPIGSYKDVYINKTEYDTIKEYTPNIKIQNAYHYFNNNPEYPFHFIKGYYNKRVAMKKDENGNEMLIKICINGGYGKTIQLVPNIKEIKCNAQNYKEISNKYKGLIIDTYVNEIGEMVLRVKENFKAGILFNPVYANEITANTRCDLFNAVKNDMNSIISFATDGIIHQNGKLNIKQHKTKIGLWDTEYKGDIIFIGSGVYHLCDKKKNENVIGVSKMRGFDTKYNLKDLLYQNRNKKFMELKLTKLIKLKYLNKIQNLKGTPDPNNNTKMINALPNIYNKMENLNLFSEFDKKININFDKKRVWDRKFKNCGEVLNSIIDSDSIKI